MMSDNDEIVSDIVTTAERGAWVDIVTACTMLGVTERTIQRRVVRGQIHRRTTLGGRTEFWIASALPDTSRATLSDIDTVVEQTERLLQAFRDELAGLVQVNERQGERLEQQAEELGRLRAEKDALAEENLRLKTLEDRQSWWQRWLLP